KAERKPHTLFSFMNPLAIQIWEYLLGAYILVSITIWIVARFSPYEWCEPTECPVCAYEKYIEESEDEDAHLASLLVLENNFTLSNSFWFTIGSLMQQGSDLNPKATSTRIVGAIWWFFTLIIIASYTANLAAFLTVERMITPIENAQDLSEQTEIMYGTLSGGSTMTFFRNAQDLSEQTEIMYGTLSGGGVFVVLLCGLALAILVAILEFCWNSKKNAQTDRQSLCSEMAEELRFAIRCHGSRQRPALKRGCVRCSPGTTYVPAGLDMPHMNGVILRRSYKSQLISLAILELQEKGTIQMLYDKWWKNTGDVCNRDDKNKESKANALGVENIGGVFVVLLCGLALAILVAILEFCWNSKKNAQTDRQSLCSEMAEELRFAIRCHGSRQRPALKRGCVRCSPGTTYVPAGLDMPHMNGQDSGILPMMEIKKSPIGYEPDI
ncbi:glutamate receptor ionotropic, kainate 2-like, partial [Diaphorina citri]|uniref:Glutamate receptor ionotropic, kainate 2-like n=1 Tax=Diaphorina citri TaxID=121845 RepID=A0A1S3DJV0_DIACI